MNKTLVTLAVALCCGFAGSAGAQMNKDEYKAQKDRVEADYKAAKDKCAPMKANAQDICKAEAKGKYEVAKAELQQQLEGAGFKDVTAHALPSPQTVLVARK